MLRPVNFMLQRRNPEGRFRFLREACFSLVGACKRIYWGLPGQVAFAEVRNDRLQAELGKIFWLAQRVRPGSRVLIAKAQSGFEAAPLLAAGASSVWCQIHHEGARKYAEARHRAHCVSFEEEMPSGDGSLFDLVLADASRLSLPELEGLVAYLGPRAILALILGPDLDLGLADPGTMSRWLEDTFVKAETYSWLPPAGCEVDLRSQAPAQARGQEYRFTSRNFGSEAGTGALGRVILASGLRADLPSERCYLHVGSGSEKIPGWINIDIEALPGVDLVLDVAESFPFSGVEAVFCEHFLEHLTLCQAFSFLLGVHRSLRTDGQIRITTPNLDYVWATHYSATAGAQCSVEDALRANRAFHGWGHRLVWNAMLLVKVLESCGFRDLEFQARGESRFPHLRGLERHQIYPDTPEIPHVLVVEGVKGALDETRARRQCEQLTRRLRGL